MTTVAEMLDPTMQETKLAGRVRDHDDHALIGVEAALARGVSLEKLRLTTEMLHQARVRFLRFGLATFLFEGSDRHLSGTVLAYLKTGAVQPEEVSTRDEDRRTLQECLDRQDWEAQRPYVETVEKASRNSQS